MPDDYEQTYTKLTRQGARVLALGLRHVGSLTPQVREMLTYFITLRKNDTSGMPLDSGYKHY